MLKGSYRRSGYGLLGNKEKRSRTGGIMNYTSRVLQEVINTLLVEIFDQTFQGPLVAVRHSRGNKTEGKCAPAIRSAIKAQWKRQDHKYHRIHTKQWYCGLVAQSAAWRKKTSRLAAKGPKCNYKSPPPFPCTKNKPSNTHCKYLSIIDVTRLFIQECFCPGPG